MKLVVIGGGITGLAAAHRAVELARERSLAVEARPVSLVGPLLVGWEAAHGPRSRPAARARRRREPRRVRAPAARRAGARARGAAAGGRHLHRRPGRPLAGGDD